MGKYKIPPDAWRAATLALLRYRENQAAQQELLNIAASQERGRKKHGRTYADPTQAAAMRLANDPQYMRIKRELAAVEKGIESLNAVQIEVIRRRFWDHPPGVRKPCPYDYMSGTGYERAAMQMIIRRVIIRTAQALGEL